MIPKELMNAKPMTGWNVLERTETPNILEPRTSNLEPNQYSL